MQIPNFKIYIKFDQSKHSLSIFAGKRECANVLSPSSMSPELANLAHPQVLKTFGILAAVWDTDTA